MAKSLKKIKALKLRQSGMSIKEIASTIGISRSTTSVWCREVVLSKSQKEKLFEKMVIAGHKGRMMGAEANKQKKLNVLNIVRGQALKEIGILSKRDILMLSLGLYWGEGSKDNQGRFVFVNSDPVAILLIINWLKIILDVKKESLRPQLYINSQHKKREEVVINFWSKKLKIPKTQFRKTIFITVPHKKIYANFETYMGVLHLSVSKGSVIKYKTMAFLDVIQKHVQKL